MDLSEAYIISAFTRLNSILKVLNNEIIVLDFSHFSPRGKSGQDTYYDIYFKSLASTEDYRSKYLKYIKGFVNDPKSSWKKYENGKQKLLYNFDNPNSGETSSIKDVFINKELDKANVSVQNDFNALEHLIKDFPQTSSLPGKCFIIYAEEHGEAQSVVYILLKEKIKIDSNSQEHKDLLEELPEHLKNLDAELHTLLIHEMVNSLVEEKTSLYRELQDLKTKMMFSLTTHSLKTHLDTGVIKLKNAFKEKLKAYPILQDEFTELDEETEELRKLTSLLSLIDKIDDETEFKKEANKSNLLTYKNSVYNLSEHLARFNSRHAAMPDVEIKSETGIDNFSLSLPIYGMYFSGRLLNLFFNTLLENAISYGKCDKNKIALTVEIKKGCWTFSNETEDETIPLDPTKIKGNLRLFQLLIEETRSGSFLIDNSKKHEFIIEIKAGIDE